MNPHATTLILVWIGGGLVSLAVGVLNYWHAAADSRAMRVAKRNGLLALAAQDHRQAELFRLFASLVFTLCGVMAADGGHTEWVIFYLVLGLIAIGLSSVRARWNRKAQLAYALSVATWSGMERRRSL
jgi:hypothetical protein